MVKLSARLAMSSNAGRRLVSLRAFGFLADPVFLGACLLYGLNRFWWKPRFGAAVPFLHDHFNDCLLIPVALPPLLSVFRLCRLRHHDGPPVWREVLEWTLIWSLVFEGMFPTFFNFGTGDWRDALSYAAGGLVAGLLWSGKVC